MSQREAQALGQYLFNLEFGFQSILRLLGHCLREVWALWERGAKARHSMQQHPTS